jgi:hypothetical protein
MKKIILTFSIFLLLTIGQTKAQYIFSVTPPTCSTCCDGTIIVTQTFCTYGAYLGGFDPFLTLATFTGNTLVYKGACCRTYTMYMQASWENCVNGTYIGTVNVCPLPTSISTNILNPEEMRLFPNPTTGKCFIDLVGEKIIVVTDPYGKILQTTRTMENQIDLFGLIPGIYFITIKTLDNRATSRQKIILE